MIRCFGNSALLDLSEGPWQPAVRSGIQAWYKHAMAGTESSEGEPAGSGALDSMESTSGSKPGAGPLLSPTERFDDILVRLRGVVEKLEGGNLSLEDSLKFFEEGIGLCRRGATILDSAERKVEVLLGAAASGGGAAGSRDVGGGSRAVPFEVPTGDDD